MLNKITLYGYFFTAQYEDITTYDILWKGPENYLLKMTTLDLNFHNQREEIVVMVYDKLYQCFAGVIGRLRNTEIEMGLYKTLSKVDQLPDLYRPLALDMEAFVLRENISCFSIFGNIKKYKSQTAAKELMKKMGYFVLSTNPPHIYLLDDYIRTEVSSLANNRAPRGSRQQ
jgi:hypothetical protein